MKWWLINNEDVETIRKALIESKQDHTLHALESGLNTTDVVPDDWK